MKRIPSWLLMTETVVLALVLVALLLTVTTNGSSLMPESVTWVVVVLAGLAFVMGLVELGRRKFDGP